MCKGCWTCGPVFQQGGLGGTGGPRAASPIAFCRRVAAAVGFEELPRGAGGDPSALQSLGKALGLGWR